jgi:hypothetical protein
MAKSKKIKNMYLPLTLTQNTDVALGSYFLNFLGQQDNYVGISDNYFESYFDNGSSSGSDLFSDVSGIYAQSWNYDGQHCEVRVSPLDVRLLGFDTNISANPVADVQVLANGDVCIYSNRIQVNGQLGANGNYQVGDKTFTIVNGLIVSIQ